MEKKLNKAGLKAAILTMSFLQMATNAISAILADIALEFPETSTVAVQYLMTFPNLLVVVMSIVTARLSVRVPKKLLAMVGLCASLSAGIGSFLFHGSIALLYFWAGVLGIGIGLVVPVAASLIADYFDGGEKDTLLGYQTAAANIGSMLMTFLGGILAVVGWYYNYLVYLLALPGIVFTMMFVPRRNLVMQEPSKKAEKTATKIPNAKSFYFVVAAVFMLLFYMGPTNLAMFVEERNIGNTMTTGTAATILLLGGTIMGLVFGIVASRMGKFTITLGFLILAVGFFMLCIAQNSPILYIGSFLVGTSNTLVLPQCMGSVVTQDKEQSTFLISAVFAIANLGTFLATALTVVAAVVMRDTMVSSRFLFTGSVAAVCVILSIIGIRFQSILE